MTGSSGGHVESNSSAGLLWTIGVIVALIVLASTCDTQTDTLRSPITSPPIAETLEAEQAPAEPAPAPDQLSVSRAVTHVRLALDSEGFPGAMIYSQNCYAAVERAFSWSKLDQCGAFDTLVGLGAVEQGLPGPEGTYFNRASAQQRYLTAAQESGAASEGLSSHLESLQTAALAGISDLQTPEDASQSDEDYEAGDTATGTDYEIDGGEDVPGETATVNALDELLPHQE